MNWPWRKKKAIYQPNRFHTIKRLELFGMLQGFWPKLSVCSVYMADEIYVLPARANVEGILQDSKIDEYIYQHEIFECNNYALLLHAYVIHKRYKDFQEGKLLKEQSYSQAFGQIWINMHALNIAITHDEGILLVEPQTDKIKKPNKKLDVTFIRI